MSHTEPSQLLRVCRRPSLRHSSQLVQYARRWCAVAVAGGATLIAAPRSAWAVTHTYCVQWRNDAEDRTYGDYVTALYQTAIGVKYEVWDGTTSVVSGYASTAGCFSFEAPSGKAHRLDVWLSSQIGVNQRFEIRSYEYVGGPLLQFVVPTVTPQCGLTSPNCNATVQIAGTPGGSDEFVTSHATVVHVLDRLDNLASASTRPTNPTDLSIIHADCPQPPADGACLDPWVSPQRMYLGDCRGARSSREDPRRGVTLLAGPGFGCEANLLGQRDAGALGSIGVRARGFRCPTRRFLAFALGCLQESRHAVASAVPQRESSLRTCVS